jgi:palmitoyltransferase
MAWPPLDPDRIPRKFKRLDAEQPFLDSAEDPVQRIEAFKKRQQEDMKRLQNRHLRKRRPFHERFDENAEAIPSDEEDSEVSIDGEEGWKNSEGERLRDFGVDEDAEFYDEDEIPLAELLRRRGLQQ